MFDSRRDIGDKFEHDLEQEKETHSVKYEENHKKCRQGYKEDRKDEKDGNGAKEGDIESNNYPDCLIVSTDVMNLIYITTL